MKTKIISIALFFAFIAPTALFAQQNAAEEAAIIKLIREKEGFPKRLIAPLRGVLTTYGQETDFTKINSYDREHAWLRDGAIKVTHAGRYNHAEYLEKTMGIAKTVGGMADVTEQYFVVLPNQGLSGHFVPEEEWNAPNTFFDNRIGPNRIGEPFSTLSHYPENVRTMPAYYAVVDMGTVDLDHIIRVERTDKLKEMVAKVPEQYRAQILAHYSNGLTEIIVYWKPRWVNRTPFSGSEYRYDDDRYYVTSWTTDGIDITGYRSRNEQGQP